MSRCQPGNALEATPENAVWGKHAATEYLEQENGLIRIVTWKAFKKNNSMVS